MASTIYEHGLTQLVPKFRVKCPICNQVESVGLLGGNTSRRFYCCVCGVEFVTKNDTICDIVQIATSGTVESIK